MNEIMKSRTIKIDNISCEGCGNRLHDSLSMLDGVKEVKADSSGVHIKYNLRKINLKDILNKIREIDYNPSRGFFQKLKRGLVNYMEENERDNLSAPVHSCCSVNCHDTKCSL